VAAGGRGRAVRLWRWRTRTAVLRLGDFPAGVGGVAFSPDGALIAAAGGNAVRVWHVPDGALVASLSARDQLTSVAFDPGEMLVAAGGTSGKTWIWDLATGALRGRVPSSGDRVTDVGFSADGRYLVTAARNGIASVWTVPGGDLVTTIRTRASDLEGAVFAPRGRKVAVAGSGGLVTVFDCAECRPLRALACLAASRVTPEVRARERKAFAACS
jgi:WD40 repeat protein